MADAAARFGSYSDTMFMRRPLVFWLRYGGFLICVITAITEIDIAVPKPLHLSVWFWAKFLCSVLYGVVFLTNVPSSVVIRPSRERWLIVQHLLGFAADPGVWFLSSFAIPFTVPEARRSLWLKVHLALFCVELSLFLFVAWLQDISRFRDQVAFVALSPARVVIFLIGVFNAMIVNLFAFAGATIILEAEASRQRAERAARELFELQSVIRESAKTEERLRISQELHDAVGHYLTSLSIQLEIASHHAEDGARPAISKSQLITRILLAEIRESVDEWKVDQHSSLPNMLGQLTQAVTGVDTHLDTETSFPQMDPLVTHSLYRSAQEAVTNVLRHSRAKNLWISLSLRDSDVRLAIWDDGRGCEQVMPGNGLNGIRSRIIAVRGQMSTRSHPGRGFAMVITVPVHKEGQG